MILIIKLIKVLIQRNFVGAILHRGNLIIFLYGIVRLLYYPSFYSYIWSKPNKALKRNFQNIYRWRFGGYESNEAKDDKLTDNQSNKPNWSWRPNWDQKWQQWNHKPYDFPDNVNWQKKSNEQYPSQQSRRLISS